ncbi:SPFH domain-containing protein [Mycoplasma sp. VS292A]|uniref:SPFH domain-containing protein n=1 Tax=Mycoplasma sp. VS292A TaxID=3401680 RepID=UPI003AB08DB9
MWGSASTPKNSYTPVYDVISYNGDDYNLNWLMYRYDEDNINQNSSLVVQPGQVAIIVHNGKVERIVKEGTTKINSEYYPFLKDITFTVHGNKNAYPINIYFVNTTLKLNVLFGTTTPLEIKDPVYGLLLRLRARGQLGLQVQDYQYLFERLVGSFTPEGVLSFDFIEEQFRGWINQNIKSIILDYLISNQISYDKVNLHLNNIAHEFSEKMKDEVDKFGFKIVTLSFDSINIPEEDRQKINSFLEKKAEIDTFGNDYRLIKGYDVLEKTATNQGTAGAFMGMGLGMGAMNSNIIPPIQNPEPAKATTVANPVQETKECPACGFANRATAKFCSECGSPTSKRCYGCNFELTPSAKFCPECGKGVQNV